jgi:hypothetical protein
LRPEVIFERSMTAYLASEDALGGAICICCYPDLLKFFAIRRRFGC